MKLISRFFNFFCILIFFISILGNFYFLNIFIHEITYPSIIGNSATFWKHLFSLYERYPWLSNNLMENIIKKMRPWGEMEPFLLNRVNNPQTVFIASWTTIETPLDKSIYNYNLIINTQDIGNLSKDNPNFIVQWEYFDDNTIIELYFKNADLQINQIELLNNQLTWFWDNHMSIDYRYIGLDTDTSMKMFQWNFCLRLLSSPIMYDIWKSNEMNDCHNIVLLRPINYPKSRINISLFPQNKEVPAEMRTLYMPLNKN